MTCWDGTLLKLGIDSRRHVRDGYLESLLTRMCVGRVWHEVLFDALTDEERRLIQECDQAGRLTLAAQRWLTLTELAGVWRRFR